MSKINSRAKGATGEREIATMLNTIIAEELRGFGHNDEVVEKYKYFVQRNQNQTAVGGCDLVNTFEFAIEIKRCQTLQINKWWEQCVRQAEALIKQPILLYRQNNKPWRCVMFGKVCGEILATGAEYYSVKTPCDIGIDPFLELFRVYARQALRKL